MGADAAEVNEFALAPPPGRLDLGRCLNSGQVFRWSRYGDAWLGVDGSDWYEIREGSTWRIRSNATENDLARFLRLDWDADAVAAECVARAPELAPYMGHAPGLRLLRPRSAPEVFYTFLCTPNNHIARIAGMVRTLASYGEVLAHHEAGMLHRFPSSEVIAAVPEAGLREVGFGYRASTIPFAACQVLDRGGDVWIENLKAVPYSRAFAELTAIKGIGPKLADCICLFGLDHTEAVPVDTHIWQAATRLYFPEWRDKPVTETRYRAVGDLLRQKLGSLAGWAQQHLFYENVVNWRERGKAEMEEKPRRVG